MYDRSDEAAEVEAGLDRLFADTRAEHPELDGASISIVFINGPTEIGTYPPTDVLYQFPRELGMEVTEEVAELSSGTGRAIPVSAERVEVLDADVIVWLEPGGAVLNFVRGIPTRDATLGAAERRSEIATDPILFAAMFNTSPLSAEYIVARLVPELAAALDDDDSTAPASTAALYGDTRTDDPDEAERAAMDAWETALDPDVPLRDKRPHVADIEELAGVVEQSAGAVDDLGGVSITATGASIIGDRAYVVFDARIGDETTAGLMSRLDLDDGTWVASRAELCTYIAFLGVTCPT